MLNIGWHSTKELEDAATNIPQKSESGWQLPPEYILNILVPEYFYVSILSPRAASGMAIKYLLIFPDWAQISESGNLKSCAKWFTRQEKWIKNQDWIFFSCFLLVLYTPITNNVTQWNIADMSSCSWWSHLPPRRMKGPPSPRWWAVHRTGQFPTALWAVGQKKIKIKSSKKGSR